MDEKLLPDMLNTRDEHSSVFVGKMRLRMRGGHIRIRLILSLKFGGKLEDFWAPSRGI